ncbi:MAG: hypothetical protein AAFX99_28560, partial [Myxococcota bacterium]
DGAVGMRIREDAPNSGDYISPPYANIRFENNTYYIADMSANEFYWGRSGGFGPGPMDAVAWDMFWDGAENFVVGDPVHRPAPKGEGPWFTFAHYGPRR